MSSAEQARRDTAAAFAARKHAGQTRIGGDPYISHPTAVAQYLQDWGFDLDYQIAGLFHDLLEDTDATEAEILALGGPEVLRAVKLLTKAPGYVMADYVAAIRKDPMARAVKAADRLHNLRCAQIASEDFKRRYVLETVDWYLDFCPEIPPAVKALADSMENPIAVHSLLYEPVNGWLESAQPGSKPSVTLQGTPLNTDIER